MEKKSEKKEVGNGFGIAGFMLGLVVFALLPIIISHHFIFLCLSVIGLILCIVQTQRKPTRLAKVGGIINIILVLLSIWVIINIWD